MPLPLPPVKNKSAPKGVPAVSATSGQDIKNRKKSEQWVSAQGVRFDLGGYHVYLIQVVMAKSSYSGMSMVAHPEVIEQERLNQMLAEASSVVVESRVVPRRQRLSASQVPITNPKKSNEECFRDDVEFLESVLIDRFGFEKVQYGAGRVELEPTIKGLNYAHDIPLNDAFLNDLRDRLEEVQRICRIYRFDPHLGDIMAGHAGHYSLTGYLAETIERVECRDHGIAKPGNPRKIWRSHRPES